MRGRWANGVVNRGRSLPITDLVNSLNAFLVVAATGKFISRLTLALIHGSGLTDIYSRPMLSSPTD